MAFCVPRKTQFVLSFGDGIMYTIRSRVMELCVRKLAQQLYECVDCECDDRALIDWNRALSYVKSVPRVVDSIAIEFIGALASEQLSDVLPATIYLDYG